MKSGYASIGLIALMLVLVFTRVRSRKKLSSASIFLIAAVGFMYAGGYWGLKWPMIAGWGLIALVGVRIFQVLASDVLANRLGRGLIAADLSATAAYAGVSIWVLLQLGINLSGVFTTSAVLTAIVGLSLQDLILNFASGLLLQFEGHYKPGLWIQTDREPGRILELRARHTRIETAEGDFLVIPNSIMVRTSVRVLSLSRRRQITFTLPYEHAPATITAAVQTALRATQIPDVARSPEPQCFVLQFHPGHIEYGIHVWGLQPGHTSNSTSVVLTRTWYALSRLGAEPSGVPQTIQLLNNEVEGSRDGLRSRAVLAGTDLFRTLSTDELEVLSRGLRELRFAPSESILRQGEEGESMFVIIRGTVEVQLRHPGGRQERVATLSEGQFFGEMSLLTGTARTASVIALTEVVCLEIEKENLSAILNSRPELASDMSSVLAERQAALSSVQESLSEQTRTPSIRQDLLGRIERFFGFRHV